jgi:hypothetical protein
MIGDQPEDSVADVNEIELVRHLIQDWHWGEPVIRMFSTPKDAKYIPEIQLSELGKKGDIDLLCASISQPQNAIAVQFKVAKIRQRTYQSLKPNKLEELHKLFQQTNILVELGFSRVFACLVILIDGRVTPEGQMVVGGLTEDLRSSLDARISLEGLHERAGFLQTHLIQLPHSAPLTTGEISSHMVREATSSLQMASLTNWVKQHVSAT